MPGGASPCVLEQRRHTRGQVQGESRSYYLIDGLVLERCNSNALAMEFYVFLALTHFYYVNLNSWKPVDVYMCNWTGSSLVIVVACLAPSYYYCCIVFCGEFRFKMQKIAFKKRVHLKMLSHIITWLAVHCFSSVHCTQCIVQIQCTRESCRLRSPPPFLVNTVKRYFVTYAAMKYATFYWNNFIWLPVI